MVQFEDNQPQSILPIIQIVCHFIFKSNKIEIIEKTITALKYFFFLVPGFFSNILYTRLKLFFYKEQKST